LLGFLPVGTPPSRPGSLPTATSTSGCRREYLSWISPSLLSWSFLLPLAGHGSGSSDGLGQSVERTSVLLHYLLGCDCRLPRGEALAMIANPLGQLSHHQCQILFYLVRVHFLSTLVSLRSGQQPICPCRWCVGANGCGRGWLFSCFCLSAVGTLVFTGTGREQFYIVARFLFVRVLPVSVIKISSL